MRVHQQTARIRPQCTGYWYLFMVNNRTENGMETPTMACVDGMPYSIAHFCCSFLTG